jgi:glycosyltransferase involved in cell wall biosynthesis
MVHANLFARLSLAFSGNKLICTIHNTHEGGRGRDLAYAATNWAACCNTTISKAATERFVSAHVLPRDTLTVYNGVDTARFRSLRPPLGRAGPFRWIAVGRLEPQKDYPTLLRALALVSDASLAIAGQGAGRTELETLTNQLGVADRVEFLGVRQDIPELLSRYDGFVLSSAWEGFGIGLVEAMAAGLPVIATRSGGPQEIIGDDGDAGLLVPTADPRALAAAMISVAGKDSYDRRMMGENARRRSASVFDINVALDRWQAIYDAVRSDLPISGES